MTRADKLGADDDVLRALHIRALRERMDTLMRAQMRTLVGQRQATRREQRRLLSGAVLFCGVHVAVLLLLSHVVVHLIALCARVR